MLFVQYHGCIYYVTHLLICNNCLVFVEVCIFYPENGCTYCKALVNVSLHTCSVITLYIMSSVCITER